MSNLTISSVKTKLAIQSKVCDDLFPIMMAALESDHPDFQELQDSWVAAVDARQKTQNLLIPMVSERYEERMEQLQKQAAEL